MNRQLPVVFVALVLASLTTLNGVAQDVGASVGQNPRLDTVTVRQPAPTEVAAFLTDGRFEYGDDVRSGESFLARLVRQILDGIARIQDAAGPVWDVGVWVVLAAIIVFAIIRLLGADFSGAVYGSAPTNAPVATVVEGIELNYLEQLQNAETAGDLRGALRWRYLLFLDRLNELGAISWRREKTNGMYEREIQDPRLRAAFRDITYWYERAWYGAWMLPENDYDRLVAQVTNVMSDRLDDAGGDE